MSTVLFVESYPQAIFGQQKTLLSLLSLAPTVGIEPVVALPGEGAFGSLLCERGWAVIQFPYPESISGYGGAVYRMRGLSRIRMLVDVLRYVGAIRKRLRALAVDAVFCNDMRGLLTVGVAARSLGIPVLIWDKLDQPHGVLDWFQLPLATRNLVISEAVCTKYPRWQQRYYAGRVRTVFNGVDLSRFGTELVPAEDLPVDTGDLVLAVVGSITRRKGQDRILAVWPEIRACCPRARLLIVGDHAGGEEDARYLENLPHRDDERVHFLGQRDDVPAILKAADMLVVPSRYEGMGQVTVEGMAAGCPVIGADTGGIPEVVVDGETGLIVDGESPNALVEAVARLAESPELRERMGAAGRARVEAHFDRGKQMRTVLEELKALA